MSKSTRNTILIIVLLYAGSLTLLGFAKPFSILSTCQRDAYADCGEFFAYFQERSDGYHGDYSEHRDADYYQTGGIILFWIGATFVLFLISEIYRIQLKPTLQVVKLNEMNVSFQEQK